MKFMKSGTWGALRMAAFTLAAVVAVTLYSGFITPVHALNPIMHNSSSTVSTYWNGGWGNQPTSKYGQFTCNTCHTAGLTGGNAKQIRSSIATPDGSPTWGTPAQTSPIAVTFGSYTAYAKDVSHTSSIRICEVCHSQTAHFRYDNSAGYATHKGTVDCMTSNCHSHSNGFKKPNCAQCHGNPPTTIATLATPSTFALRSSAGTHATHANTKQIGCDACHKGYNYGDNKIQLGFQIDKTNWAQFQAGRSVTFGTYTGRSILGAGYTWQATPAAAPQAAIGTKSGSSAVCSVYCHGAWPNSGATRPDWAAAGSVVCGSCHGASAASPPARGSHQKHAGNGTFTGYSFSCTNCHHSRALGDNHLDGAVQLAFSTGKAVITTSASYNGLGATVTTANVAPSSTYYSCSGLYCHSNGTGTVGGTTPVWGGSLNADCTSCHGNDKQSINLITTGRHRAHLDNYTTLGRSQSFGCVDCHAKTVSGNRAILANPVNHVNGLKDYSGARAGGSASYGNLGAKGCSASYCHSSGQATPVFRIMTGNKNWTGSTTLTCNGCHGVTTPSADFVSNYGAPNYPNTGGNAANSHKKHVYDANFTSTTACAKCHRTTVDATAPNKLRDYSSAHLDRVRNVSFAKLANYTGHYTAGTKTCGNTYCHSSGQPVWGVTVTNCSSCHNGGSALPATSQHSTHWTTSNGDAWKYLNYSGNQSSASAYRFQCNACHNGNHANGPTGQLGNNGFSSAEIYFNYTTPGKAGGYNFGSTSYSDGSFRWSDGRCRNTYCHSNGAGAFGNNTSIRWNSTSGFLTNATTGRCTGCHGGKAGTFKVMTTGRHRVHMGGGTTLQTLQCAECHAKTVAFSNNTSVANKAVHINKYRDYSGVRAYKSFYTGPSIGCDNNAYCHTSGKKGVTGVTTVPQGVTWSQTNTWGGVTCNKCHGTENSYGAPGYTTAGAAQPGANSHSKHATGSSDCVKCHFRTTQNGTSIVAGGSHLNSAINVNISKIPAGQAFTTYSGLYNSGTKTCSATYCHGGLATSPQWGLVTSGLSCNTCHSANAAGSGSGVQTNWSSSTGSAHRLHWEDKTALPWKFANTTTSNIGTASTYRFNCGACHNPGSAQHASGAVSANRAAQVFFGYTSPGRNPSYAEGTLATNDNGFNWTGGTSNNCTSTYCHSNGNNANGRVPVNWNTTAKTADCSACHGGNASAFTTMSTGRHRAHVENGSAKYSNGNFGCGECHAKTVAIGPAGSVADRTLVDKTKHLNKFKDYSGARAFKSRYAGSNATCSTYCHSNGKNGTSAGIFKGYTTWYNTNFTVRGALGCNGCHGTERGGTAAGFPNYTSGNAGTAVANSHRRHVGDKGISCNNCHKNTTTNGTSIAAGGYHINGSSNTDVYFGTYSSSWRATYTPSASGGYIGSGNKTCSTVSCHSNGKGTYITMQWGGTTNCGVCHPINGLKGAHRFHIYTSATYPTAYSNMTANRSNGAAAPGRYNFGCASCHPLTAPGTHANGTGTVVIDLRNSVKTGQTVGTLRNNNTNNISASGTVGSLGTGTTGTPGTTVKCFNVYCHSNGGNGVAVAFQGYTTPDWYNPVLPTDPCSMCHGNWPNSARRGDGRVMLGSATHYNGNWLGTTVPGGHAMGVHADKITNAAQFTALLTPAASPTNGSHGDLTQATTINCNTCHWATVTTSTNNNSNQCYGCHLVAADQAPATIFNKAKHVNGTVDVLFRSMTTATNPFRVKAQLRDSSFKNVSSSTLWHRNNSYKSTTSPYSYDSAKQNLNIANNGGYTTANGCSNVICHFNQNVKWTNPAPAVTCNSCHQSNPPNNL